MSETKPQTDKLLTNKEAAQFLRTSTITLYRLRRSGRLPYSRLNGSIRYRLSELESLLRPAGQGGGH